MHLQILKKIGSTTEIPHGNTGRLLKLGSCRFIYVNFLLVNVALSFSVSAQSRPIVSGSGQYANFSGAKLILNSD